MIFSPDVSIVENNQPHAVIAVLSSAENVLPNYALSETLLIDTLAVAVFSSHSFRAISLSVFLFVWSVYVTFFAYNKVRCLRTSLALFIY